VFKYKSSALIADSCRFGPVGVISETEKQQDTCCFSNWL